MVFRWKNASLSKRSGWQYNRYERNSNELWVYDVTTKKHRKIFYDGYNPKWSPTENIVAFSAGGVLNIADLEHFYNIALGVDDYAWQPDGKGFIASSSATPAQMAGPTQFFTPFRLRVIKTECT